MAQRSSAQPDDASGNGKRLLVWEAFARYGKVPPLKIVGGSFRLPYLNISIQQHYAEAKTDACLKCSHYSLDLVLQRPNFCLRAAVLGSALSLANDDVRAAAAWRFASIFFAEKTNTQAGPSVQERWKEIGHRFFDQVWPLEPTLQSSASANDFARIPACVRTNTFCRGGFGHHTVPGTV